MTAIMVMTVSIALQFTAAGLAVRLIRITGRIRAWMLVAIAFAIMGARRLVTFVDHFRDPVSHPLNLETEILALVVSALLVSGMIMIGPVFRRLEDTRSEMLENRSILQGVLDHSPAIISVRDLNGTFMLINNAYAEAFGTGDVDVRGQRIEDLRTPEFTKKLKKYDREVIETGAPLIHEHDAELAHGTGRLLTVRFPIRDDAGQIVAIGAMATDITVQSAIQDEFKAQSERYERATTAGRIGIWEWDPSTDAKYVTPNWERMVGCGDGEHIHSMKDWLARLHPSCHPDTDQRLDLYRQSTDEVIAEYPVVLLDGTTYWFETRAISVFDDDGRLLKVLGLDTDVTERKIAERNLLEREAMLSSVIDNLPVGLLIRDKNLTFERMNNTFMQWYGINGVDAQDRAYDRLDSYTGDARDYKAEGEVAQSQEREVLESGKALQRQLERTFADGQKHTIRVTKFPIFNASGSIEKVGSVSVDLTELIHAQAELEKTNRELEAASRAKSDFLAHMSHELRTPLNSVIGFSQMMSEQTLGPMQNEAYLDYATHIQSSAQHLLSLINDILDISKVEAGEADLNETVVDVRDCVSDSLKLIPQYLRDKSHNISVSIPANEIKLLADQRLLRQVLVNLISNALKFTPDGGEVRVSTRHADTDAFQVLVSDDGIGMTPEDIPQALAPFGQVRRSAEVSHGGTGLGLPLSKQLIELHGGELNIESELDHGTTVILTFPGSRKVPS